MSTLPPPEAVIEELGTRPPPGPAAQAWDRAAGQLHQHQSVFDLQQGLGRRPAIFDHSVYTDSRAEVQRLLPSVVRAPQRRGREIESLGIEL